MMDGAFEHQDSTGGGGLITDGATQWMTAGAGILHIERPPEALVTAGGLFHGVQLWVNLPAAAKWTPARYQDISGGDVTLLASPDGGALIRVIAGSLDGHEGPGSTFTPITYLHLTVSPGARVNLPWPKDFNALVYVLAGRGLVGAEQRPLDEGQLAVFGSGDVVEVAAPDSQPQAAATGWEILVLGGLPIGEPVARYGPFVMNTRAEILQALEDFEAGRMGRIPAERVPHRTETDDPGIR
jgi:redox-sensitive bicupin YhaK (pirin superfamily)